MNLYVRIITNITSILKSSNSQHYAVFWAKFKKKQVANHHSASPKKKHPNYPPHQPQPTTLPTKSSLISEGKAAISFRSNQLTSWRWKLGINSLNPKFAWGQNEQPQKSGSNKTPPHFWGSLHFPKGSVMDSEVFFVVRKIVEDFFKSFLCQGSCTK